MLRLVLLGLAATEATLESTYQEVRSAKDPVVSGMRDESKAAAGLLLSQQTSLVQKTSSTDKQVKAHGKCGEDVHVCSTGEEVRRDEALSCRFTQCASSLIEDYQPTYQWQGASISANQSFCARMSHLLGNYQDLSVTTCSGQANCEEHYVHMLSGQAGDIAHCRLNTAGDCEQGAVHNCTWSFYMEDLIQKHNSSENNCASELLEAKRSLDGLLHSVQDVYNQLMQWNEIVQAENQTIRGLLQDQQDDWDEYMSAQMQCQSEYGGNGPDIQNILNEMTELRAIANPDARSAVDLRRGRGYQSSGTTSMSCPAEYPFVSSVDSAYCCSSESNITDPAKTGCTNRNCRDENDISVPCVNNTRADGTGMLRASQTAAVAAASLLQLGESTDEAAAAATSFAEVVSTTESACQSFVALVQRVEKTHGTSLLKHEADPSTCHQARADLESDFRNAFKELGRLYNLGVMDEDIRKTECFNLATYNYKAGVEGVDGIDDKIQDSAGKIHEAQGEIARLEPMLHDVERAVERMRSYIESVTSSCGEEAYIGHLYEFIRDEIVKLQECPGRNDFFITVPHWTPSAIVTPSPTPWFQSDRAAGLALR